MTTETAYVYDAKVAAIHMLRVNVKSLAAESRIIRKEERRCGILYQPQLWLHRTTRLREESRYAQLALAFVRQKPYAKTELVKRVDPVNAVRLAKKIGNFCSVSNTAVENWLAGK